MYDSSLTTQLVRDAWAGLGVVWLLGAIRSKPAVRRGSGAVRIMELCFLAIAFSLLFQVRPWCELPFPLAVKWFGVILTFAGAGFAIWARFILGGNWSASVTVKRDHTLICSGPYGIVRHPIYTGLLLAALGAAIAFADLKSFLAPPLLAFAWRRKSLVEEEFMRNEFGDEYRAYATRVKALIPFVW
uniref:Isoprenylcysteine carboxyl methyltransferase n=1 Tax=Solibacter usitatus (strain Ellin6076) TaxID=234267 RepID=Q02AE1_SOLUE